jgi:hypothetical protein
MTDTGKINYFSLYHLTSNLREVFNLRIKNFPTAFTLLPNGSNCKNNHYLDQMAENIEILLS